ncbi:hypothetical protein [Spiroplasma alleghenense]|uniref:Uncharacterized protein n=1 Tax=Spiroplasma alleghenense TaxID=216931 RepID=A0A345Z4T3_9MOLU|nr:hypothetical protein [Spiroplasma alleghenense]AXK51612.1 hypothetical protein SALLE_v1c09420 [Spiroplasma alleghenense]
MGPNYNYIHKIWLQNNLEKFNVNGKSEKEKIKKFCEKFNFDESDVFKEIEKSPYLKWTYSVKYRISFFIL